MVDPRNPNDPYDPRPMHDPIDPVNPRTSGYRELDQARGTNWGWIIGGVVALFLVFAFVFGFSGNDRTASTGSAPVTTGQTTTPPAATPPTARAPATTPQENTGAAPRTTPQ